MKKTTTKKTKKVIKPAYTVYMDNMQTLDDIEVEYALAKQDAGLAMTDSEFSALVHHIAKNAAPVITFVNCICDTPAKKPNIFKRFWNWITRKK